MIWHKMATFRVEFWSLFDFVFEWKSSVGFGGLNVATHIVPLIPFY